MKTLVKLLAYASLVTFALFAYSCSDDDDDNNGNNAPSYFNHEGHSYLVVKESKTWVQAAADAVSKGGYLVEINSQAEQNAVYQGILNSVSSGYTQVTDGGGIAYVWIGATDRATEGSWLWNGSNGTLFWQGNNSGAPVSSSYYNWGGKSAGTTNEPDNFTDSQYSPNGQNAAAIGLATWPAGSSSAGALGKAGEWNDITDTNKIYYVIEFNSIKE